MARATRTFYAKNKQGKRVKVTVPAAKPSKHANARVGTVIKVRMRGGCTQDLKKFGKSKKYPSGWGFVKGTRRCPR
jgi:hypothetical protein